MARYGPGGVGTIYVYDHAYRLVLKQGDFNRRLKFAELRIIWHSSPTTEWENEMYKSLVLGFVSLTLLAGCSDDPAKNDQFFRTLSAVGAGLSNIDSGSTPSSSNSAPSSQGGFLQDSYTQGLNKVCIYNRNGNIDTRVISSVGICPLSI